MASPYSRRVFLAYSAHTLGALPTLIGSSLALTVDTPVFATDATFKHLRAEDQSMLAILLPITLGVKLDPSNPEDQRLLTQTMMALDHIMDQLSVRSRDDLMLLLTLLGFPLTRMALGLWNKWEDASRDEVLRFLSRWERSVMSLKRFGYQSLVQLMEYAFYGVPGNTTGLGYPGIPASIQPFLRRLQTGGG